MARTETFHNMGFRLTYPDVFDHTLGQVPPMAFGDTGDGVYFMMYSYIAVSAEDMNAMAGKSESGELSEEDKLKVADAMGSLLVVAGMGGAQGPEEIAEKMKMGDVPKDSFTEIGRYRDIVYYAIIDRQNDEAFMKEMEPAFAEEFRILQPALIEALKNAEFIGPQIPGADLVGRMLNFEK
jgi:hypothetical protein